MFMRPGSCRIWVSRIAPYDARDYQCLWRPPAQLLCRRRQHPGSQRTGQVPHSVSVACRRRATRACGSCRRPSIRPGALALSKPRPGGSPRAPHVRPSRRRRRGGQGDPRHRHRDRVGPRDLDPALHRRSDLPPRGQRPGQVCGGGPGATGRFTGGARETDRGAAEPPRPRAEQLGLGHAVSTPASVN